MKIAIITANIGDIDNVMGIPLQNNKIDYYIYHDLNLPFPLPNLNDRLKSKYIKIQTHRFLPQYDLYIWLDGRVQILSKDFVKEMIENIMDYDMCMFNHRERKSVYEEIGYIIKNIKLGNHYLLSRYGNQCLEKEARFYREEGIPKNYPLYACTIFARWNNKKVNDVFDEWWKRCIEFSYFDQTMFSYCAYKFDLKINALEFNNFVKVLTVNKHK